MVKQRRRDAPEQEPQDAAPAVRRHDDEADLGPMGNLEDHAGRRPQADEGASMQALTLKASGNDLEICLGVGALLLDEPRRIDWRPDVAAREGQ